MRMDVVQSVCHLIPAAIKVRDEAVQAVLLPFLKTGYIWWNIHFKTLKWHSRAYKVYKNINLTNLCWCNTSIQQFQWLGSFFSVSQPVINELRWPLHPSLVLTCNWSSLHSWKFLFYTTLAFAEMAGSHCQDKRHKILIFLFCSLKNALCVNWEDRKKDQMRRSPFFEAKATQCFQGIPSPVWLTVFSVQKPDSWDFPMSYFLLFFWLGSGFPFPSHRSITHCYQNTDFRTEEP